MGEQAVSLAIQPVKRHDRELTQLIRVSEHRPRWARFVDEDGGRDRRRR
jgi:hypothetical protein